MAMGVINVVTMARTPEFTSIKQNEDNRASMTQMTMGQQEDKAVKQRAQQVVNKEETAWHQRKFDAKEQGDNQYSGDGGKKRNQADKVVVKGQQGFDVKV